jgi:hypothetical protein
VVSGGLLCLAGLVAVVRLFPQLLDFELRHDHPEVASPADTTPA